MAGGVLYWFAAALFLLLGAGALIRPAAILEIRARFRPPDQAVGVRKVKFGPAHVRICGAALMVIGVALIVTLAG